MWKYSYKCVLYLFCACFAYVMYHSCKQFMYPKILLRRGRAGTTTHRSYRRVTQSVTSPAQAMDKAAAACAASKVFASGCSIKPGPKPISDSGVFQMMINCFDFKKATCFILGFSFIIPSNSLPRFHKGCDICSTIWRRFQITHAITCHCNYLRKTNPPNGWKNEETQRQLLLFYTLPYN